MHALFAGFWAGMWVLAAIRYALYPTSLARTTMHWTYVVMLPPPIALAYNLWMVFS